MSLYNADQSEDEFVQACRNALGDYTPTEAQVERYREDYRRYKADEVAEREAAERDTYSTEFIHDGKLYRVNRYYWGDDGKKVPLNDEVNVRSWVYTSTGNRDVTAIYHEQESD